MNTDSSILMIDIYVEVIYSLLLFLFLFLFLFLLFSLMVL